MICLSVVQELLVALVLCTAISPGHVLQSGMIGVPGLCMLP